MELYLCFPIYLRGMQRDSFTFTCYCCLQVKLCHQTIEACIFHIRPNFHFPLTIYVVLPMHLFHISLPPPHPCGDHFLTILPSFVQHVHTISFLCFLPFLSQIRQLHFFPYCFRSHSVLFCSVCQWPHFISIQHNALYHDVKHIFLHFNRYIVITLNFV